MSPAPEVTGTNWFQQNPKKTLALITGVALLCLVAATEKFLQFYNHRHGVFLETAPRYIRLREHRPLTRLMLPFSLNQPFRSDHVPSKKYRLTVDRDGFIMPSRKYAQPDLSLVFLGGSTTECLFVDEENRFPYLAGVILEGMTGKKINSYNGAMSGNNSLNSIDILVNKVIPLKPRVVVFMENINDLSTLLYEGTYWNKNSSRSPVETMNKTKWLGKLLKEICIPNINYAYRNLKDALFQDRGDEFAAARGKKLKIDPARLNREFAMNLETIVNICQIRGIIPVLMTQASRITAQPDQAVKDYFAYYLHNSGINYQDVAEAYDSFNETIRRVGRQNQVLVIDLARGVPPDETYIYDMVHFNDTGSKYAAQIIAARLKDRLTP
ncbi:MAG: SGNH/GDSL hydrolase family protein [Thermodesulfobacteriota bacterium]